MTKKILLASGILIIVGIAAFLIFSSTTKQENGESRVGFSILNFLPFGGNEDTETSTTESVSNNEITTSSSNTESQSIPRLRKISTEPVAGAVIFNNGTTTLVRFVEKGTGNVYQAASNSTVIQRLTNTTIPKIIRAFWLPNASGFLAQTLTTETEVIETNFVKLNKTAASSTDEDLTPFNTTISSLPTKIQEITIKPDSSKIFYYTNSGSSSWFISNPDGTGSVLVATNPLTEWYPDWISENSIVMQTKGSYKSIGYVYIFNPQTKSFGKIGTGFLGISANLNLDKSLSLVSSGNKLFIVNNNNVSTTELSTNSLAEKCVWLNDKSHYAYCAFPDQLPNGNYPDDWYKGKVATEDFIKKVDLDNDIYYNISDLADESGEKIDVVNLSLSPDGNYLIFRNKIDGYLWMLRIVAD